MSALLAWVLCTTPIVVDGDTFRCNGESIRIAGIDAPDTRCPARRANNCRTVLENGTTALRATRELHRTLRARTPTGAPPIIRLRLYRGTTYGRRIAVVCVNGANVSDALIASGHARYMPTWNGAARRVKCL